MFKTLRPLAAILLLGTAAYAAPAGEAEMKGAVQVPAFQLPLPIHMSPEAKAAYAAAVGDANAPIDFADPNQVKKRAK